MTKDQWVELFREKAEALTQAIEAVPAEQWGDTPRKNINFLLGGVRSVVSRAKGMLK